MTLRAALLACLVCSAAIATNQTSDGATVIQSGDVIEVEFLTEGSLGHEVITRRVCRPGDHGSDPGFQVSIIGADGWAGEGRINSVVSSPPIEITDATVSSNDWQYIGEVDTTALSGVVVSQTSFIGTLFRGDAIVIDGTKYTVSTTGSYGPTTVPLSSPFLGATQSGLSLFRVSKACTTGTHTIAYTPFVKGSYEIDVKLHIEDGEFRSIAGFPRTVNVSPARTSSAKTSAYGRGLKYATAGQEAMFKILPKDLSGNDSCGPGHGTQASL